MIILSGLTIATKSSERWHLDMHQVSRHFPQAMLLAREVDVRGATETVVTEANLNGTWPTDGTEPGCPRMPPPTPEHAE